MNLPAAGSCLRAENSELRVLAPSRLRSYFHTRAESLGCHPEACRSLCPSPKQKRARSRTHHPTRWLPPCLTPSSDRENQKKKNLPPRRDAAEGTPTPPLSPPASSASQQRRAAWGRPGCGRLPGNFCLVEAQVQLRQARAPGRARQKRTLLRGGGGTQALNQLFSSLRAPCAPCPARGIRPPAARMCNQKGCELERGTPAALKNLSL